jgi:hypothetical protein
MLAAMSSRLGVRSLAREALFPAFGAATMAALFFGVDGAPAAPVDEAVWREDLPTILAYRLSGLALAAARASGVTLPADVQQQIKSTYTGETMNGMRIETLAVQVAQAFEKQSIPMLVVKGPTIARFYPEPTLRPFHDVDVLVAPSLFDAAARVLASLGFVEHDDLMQPRAYFNRSCREAVNLVRADNTSVDLHHHVPPWIWGARLSFDRLCARSTPMALDRGDIPALSNEHTLLLAALHLLSDKSRPGATPIIWRDVIAIAAACDPAAVATEARALRLDWLLALVLAELPSWAQPAALVSALGTPQVSAPDRARARLLLPPGIGSKMLAHAFRIPAPNAMAFVAGYLLPSRAYLRHELGARASYPQWWRHAVRNAGEALQD